MVSRNLGITYKQEAEAKTVDELKPRGEELDRQWKRWTIEDEDGEVLVWCRIHNGIAALFE